jgi:hypothetical protein
VTETGSRALDEIRTQNRLIAGFEPERRPRSSLTGSDRRNDGGAIIDDVDIRVGDTGLEPVSSWASTDACAHFH